MTSYDTVVIGAGIIGSTLALQLQEAGARVVLVESDLTCRGASYGNAGWIATELVRPYANWHDLLAAPGRLSAFGGPIGFIPRDAALWVGWAARFIQGCQRRHQGEQSLTALMADALMAWCRLADSIGARHLLRTQGNIVVWRGASAAMRRRKAWLTQSRGSATVRDLSQLEKFALDRLFLSRVATALKVENTGQISNLSGMIEALHAAFQQAGGLIRKDHVRALSAEHSSVTVLFTAGGSVTPERVVVAAGVQSGALLKTLGLRVPLIAERGYHLHYHRHDWPADAPAVLVEDRSVVLTPMDTGLRATSFVEFGRPDSPPDPRKWRRLERHLAELGVSVEGKPERWHGARPTLPDYLPAIGSSTRYRNLAYAFGHQHIGLTLAAATAELLTRELSSGHPEAVLAPFSLRRYLGDRI